MTLFKHRVCIIATHPDDETLGAGGTLLKHKAQGDEIHCIFCTHIFEDEGFSKEQINQRNQEITEVCQLYGFDSVHCLNLKTTKLDEYPKSAIIEKFSTIFRAIEPTILYLPFAHDVHSDHRIIFETALSCTKSFRYPSIQKILMMETLSETEFAPSFPHQSFIPNVFVDISPYMAQKCKIMQIYKSEIAPPPFPRSIENIQALALYRGSTMGACNSYGGGGIDEKAIYAESFMLLKERM